MEEHVLEQANATYVHFLLKNSQFSQPPESFLICGVRIHPYISVVQRYLQVSRGLILVWFVSGFVPFFWEIVCYNRKSNGLEIKMPGTCSKSAANLQKS